MSTRAHYGLETAAQVAIAHTGCQIIAIMEQERGQPIVRFRGNAKQRSEAAAILRRAGYDPMPEGLR